MNKFCVSVRKKKKERKCLVVIFNTHTDSPTVPMDRHSNIKHTWHSNTKLRWHTTHPIRTLGTIHPPSSAIKHRFNVVPCNMKTVKQNRRPSRIYCTLTVASRCVRMPTNLVEPSRRFTSST